MHLTLAAGSFSSWGELPSAGWESLLNAWSAPLQPVAPARATSKTKLSVLPYAVEDVPLTATAIDAIQRCIAGEVRSDRIVGAVGDVPIEVAIIDSGADRLAHAGNAITAQGKRITEKAIDSEIFGPSGEPDLVVACGPSTAGVPSLVWELAYSEIVYLNLAWREVGSNDLDRAIRDFHNRNRRFGGV